MIKRVFEIDMEHCPNRGGELKIIAAILEQPVIEKIRTHLGLQARAPPGASPRPGATSGLTLPICDCSGDPMHRAAGVDCVRGFAGPMKAARRQGITRRRRPRKTTFRCALNGQRISATLKDRLKRVGRCVRGARGKEQWRVKTLCSHTHSVHAAALACLHRGLSAFHYMVAVAGGDSVRLTPYFTIGSEALSSAVVDAMRYRDACLMSNHDLIAAGSTLARAMKVAQEIESLCEGYL